MDRNWIYNRTNFDRVAKLCKLEKEEGQQVCGYEGPIRCLTSFEGGGGGWGGFTTVLVVRFALLDPQSRPIHYQVYGQYNGLVDEPSNGEDEDDDEDDHESSERSPSRLDPSLRPSSNMVAFCAVVKLNHQFMKENVPFLRHKPASAEMSDFHGENSQSWVKNLNGFDICIITNNWSLGPFCRKWSLALSSEKFLVRRTFGETQPGQHDN
ncbi:hypothetical protein HAX54_047629 [Datura stramonium]|uniref:Uncharacterized protein n=1 Tax=Datura stramonium TaxID=4076 RepID=A0ABS8WKR6_DATST|nr:hypothetical protein [Datura stramonium]